MCLVRFEFRRQLLISAQQLAAARGVEMCSHLIGNQHTLCRPVPHPAIAGVLSPLGRLLGANSLRDSAMGPVDALPAPSRGSCAAADGADTSRCSNASMDMTPAAAVVLPPSPPLPMRLLAPQQ